MLFKFDRNRTCAACFRAFVTWRRKQRTRSSALQKRKALLGVAIRHVQIGRHVKSCRVAFQPSNSASKHPSPATASRSQIRIDGLSNFFERQDLLCSSIPPNTILVRLRPPCGATRSALSKRLPLLEQCGVNLASSATTPSNPASNTLVHDCCWVEHRLVPWRRRTQPL